jgi:hypothetical protein
MAKDTIGAGSVHRMADEATTYEFLSLEWIEAAQRIRAEVGEPTSTPVPVTMNLIVTDAPFETSPLEAHLDTSEGALALDYGHRPEPDILITVDWATAKALLVDGNTQAAMSAFMAGRVRVEGDMGKLMALSGSSLDERSERVVVRLREITA